MANMKNAKKAIKTIKKRKVSNNEYKASMRTAIKNVDKAVFAKDEANAKETLAIAIKKIDKACSKGVVTSNFAARNKSRLTRKVNEMK